MGILYIIGNGFDLHFGLHTDTEDFEKIFATKRIYGELENAYEVLLNSYGVDWSKYEASLAGIDLDEIEEQNIGFPDYLSDHESDRNGVIFNMQMYLESVEGAIQSSLEDMVDAANDALEDIALAMGDDDELPNAAAILSFNYTSTVERLFQIPEEVPILHIHGFREARTPPNFRIRATNRNISKKIGP